MIFSAPMALAIESFPYLAWILNGRRDIFTQEKLENRPNIDIIKLTDKCPAILANSMDWHPLLEICALTDTLILDEEGIYEPVHCNDRLLLGLKGP